MTRTDALRVGLDSSKPPIILDIRRMVEPEDHPFLPFPFESWIERPVVNLV
jgi:hypothetical protein